MAFICRPRSLRPEKDPRSKPGRETWSCHVSGCHVLRPIPPLSLVMGRSVRGFCLLRSATFAVTRCAVPDGQNHFSGQAEVIHSYLQQFVATRPLAFRSERFPLLFNQREHFSIRRMAGGRQSPRSSRCPVNGRGPAAPAVIGSHGQVRPEPACIKVKGAITET